MDVKEETLSLDHQLFIEVSCCTTKGVGKFLQTISWPGGSPGSPEGIRRREGRQFCVVSCQISQLVDQLWLILWPSRRQKSKWDGYCQHPRCGRFVLLITFFLIRRFVVVVDVTVGISKGVGTKLLFLFHLLFFIIRFNVRFRVTYVSYFSWFVVSCCWWPKATPKIEVPQVWEPCLLDNFRVDCNLGNVNSLVFGIISDINF